MITERFAQALAVAIQAHDGQLRKGTTIPYISHPIGVSSIAMEYGADEDQAIAALLHDVLEDAEPQVRPHFEVIIKSQFGSRVFEIVLAALTACQMQVVKSKVGKRGKLPILNI